jgi:hypothetical protein
MHSCPAVVHGSTSRRRFQHEMDPAASACFGCGRTPSSLPDLIFGTTCHGPPRDEGRARLGAHGKARRLPDHGFHLDVLPAIPDVDYAPTGILLTDVELRAWPHSNPIGYATWFRNRSEELQSLLAEAAAKRHVNVADVPEWEVRSTLQRVVQVLKWHSMLHFANEPDIRPPSILITTLAGQAYAGEHDLYTATRNALNGMTEFIEKRDGKWWVSNPAHEDENFADKWNDYPERRTAFFAWHRDIKALLDELLQLQGKGLDVVTSRMYEGFGHDAVQRSVKRYQDHLRGHRESGVLRMGTTGLITTTTNGARVRDHTFHGDYTDTRH